MSKIPIPRHMYAAPTDPAAEARDPLRLAVTELADVDTGSGI
jgi:hypothetical protein